MWADGNSSSLALAGKAARVAVLANTRHGRLLSVTATHRLCRDSLRALDGVALEASSAWRLLAVAVLRRRQASRGWHGQRKVRASQRVASDGRRGSWARRCGENRRQPAALRLGSGCGGRRARASIHTPWQWAQLLRRAHRRLERQERAGGSAERRSASARVGGEPIGSSPRSPASICGIGGAASILARMSRWHAARALRADRAMALNWR